MTDFPGWKYYQTVTPSAAVHSGALTGYQYPIKVIVGSGTAAAYTHQTGIGGSLIYVPSGHCRSDFYDFRFYVGSTLCDHHRISKTDNVQAEFNVELPNDATSPEAIIIRYGNFYAASDTSSADNTYVSAPISGVVGAWALEEADAEVNPTVITDDDQTTFWAPSLSVTLTNETTIKSAGTNSLKAVFTNSNQYDGFTHIYGANQNWSIKNIFRLWFKGSNSNIILSIKIVDAANNFFYYNITDNSTSERQLSIPYSSFTAVGAASWTTIKQIQVICIASNISGTFYFDRFVLSDGVVAVDSSGYGNNGAATGTTVQTTGGPYTGKNYRLYNGVSGGDRVQFNANIFNQATFATGSSVIAWIKFVTLQAADVVVWTIEGRHQQIKKSVGHSLYVDTYDGVTNYTTYSNAAISAGVWYFVAATWDGTTQKLYLQATKQTDEDVATVGAIDAVSRASAIGSQYTAANNANVAVAGLTQFNVALSATQISAIYNSGTPNYPDVGLVVDSVCPRKYASTTNPTHDTATGEVASTSGDEQYYYYNEYFTLTPEQEAKLSPQQKQRRAQHEATLHPTEAKLSRIDWSNQANESHMLDLSSSRILEEAKQLGLIKKRN